MSLYNLINPQNGGKKRTSYQILRFGVPMTRYNTLPLPTYCDALARCEREDDYNIAHTLAKYLRANGDLSKTRIICKDVSRIFSEAGELGKLFDKIFISPRYADDMCDQERDRMSLARISPECRELVAHFPQPTFGTFTARSAPGVVFRGLRSRGDDNDWPFIFERCRYIRTLTITTGMADADNPTDKINAAIDALRTALAGTRLRTLDTLRLVGVDAMYFRALKWRMPAPGPTLGLAGYMDTMIWNNISKLEIQILPRQQPDDDLVRAQEAKLLHAFLGCMAPRLKSLKFAYLKREGTHPFRLLGESEPKAAGQDDIHCPQLTDLWLGRVQNVEEARSLYKGLAPQLERCWELAWSETGGQLEFRCEAKGEAWKIRRLADGSTGAAWDSGPFRSAPKTRTLSQETVWPSVVPSGSGTANLSRTSAPSEPTTWAAPPTRPMSHRKRSSASTKAASAIAFLRRPSVPAMKPLARVFRSGKALRRRSTPPPTADTEATEGTEMQELAPPTTSPRQPELTQLADGDAPDSLRHMTAFDQQSWFRAGSGARLPDEVVRRNKQQVEAALTRSRLRRESEQERPSFRELLRAGSVDEDESRRSSAVTMWPTAEDLATAPENPDGGPRLLISSNNRRAGAGGRISRPAAAEVGTAGERSGRVVQAEAAGDRASQVTVWPTFPASPVAIRETRASLARLEVEPQSPFMGARSHWRRLQNGAQLPEEEGPGQEQGREHGEGSARRRNFF